MLPEGTIDTAQHLLNVLILCTSRAEVALIELVRGDGKVVQLHCLSQLTRTHGERGYVQAILILLHLLHSINA